jgi:sigma-E factor negative regulatory protein RseC
VHVRERLAWRAVLLAYVLPFVVLAGVLAGLQLSGKGEAVAGTGALCAVGVYYIVLSLFKGRLKKSFTFTAEKVEENN